MTLNLRLLEAIMPVLVRKAQGMKTETHANSNDYTL